MKNSTAKIFDAIYIGNSGTHPSLYLYLGLLLTAGWLAGCSSLNDYISQPMVIDASQRQVPSAKWENRYENNPNSNVTAQNSNQDSLPPSDSANPGSPQTSPQWSDLEYSQTQNPPAFNQQNQNSYTNSTQTNNPVYDQPLSADPPRVAKVTIQEVPEQNSNQKTIPDETNKPALASNSVDQTRPNSSPANHTVSPEQNQIATAPVQKKPTGEDILLDANISANDSVTPALNIRDSSLSLQSMNLTQPALAQRPQNQNNSYRIDDTILELEKHIAQNPDDIHAQIALRCLYLAYGQEEKALQLLPELPADQQAKSLALTQAVHLSAKTLADKGSDTVSANQALEAVNNLSSQLADKADLVITRLEICKPDTVKGFGRFEVFPLTELETGHPRTVQVYCELRNFKSEVNAEGKFLSKLHCKIVLYDVTQNYKILKQEEDDIQDVPSNSSRQDFFLRGSLDIPQLEPGKYQLVVTMEDQIARKIARPAKIDFEVKPGSNSVP